MTTRPTNSKSYIYKDKEGENGTIRRSWLTLDGPLYDARNTNRVTLYDNWRASATLYKNRPFWGERTLNSDGTAGDYAFSTYNDANQTSQNLKSAFANCGLQPRDHVGLYGPNCAAWSAVDIACTCYSLATVPLYDTLGPDAADYVIKNAEIKAVVCSIDHLDGVMKSSLSSGLLEFVVIMPLRPFEDTPERRAYFDKTLNKYRRGSSADWIPVYTWPDMLSRGAANPVQDVPPQPSDIATICYTSGTTGVPKGAVLEHHTLMTMTGAVAEGAELAMTAEDLHISYLPMAHMFERLNQFLVIYNGGASGFSRGDVTVLLEDIAALRPTIFAGVPRLWNRLYDKIMAQVDSSGAVKKFIFNKAFQSKLALVQAGDKINKSRMEFAFQKVRDVLGGRVRLITTGSAPVAGYILEFLRVVFDATVMEGYGQTECGAAATLTTASDINPMGHIGVPIPSMEVKLVSVPEMDYTVFDKDENGNSIERGEICLRGNTFRGYWKMPEKSAETLDSDGWLHTGDIGTWTSEGCLKIIDRKKNIFKLSQGEYVAPEKIENVYIRSKWIAQCFIYGDSLKPNLVSIVVLDEEQMGAWTKSKGIAGGMTEWANNEQVRRLVDADMKAVAKAAKLHGFEQAKAFHIHDDLFTPENGILTPTFKMKRPQAKKVFQDVIDRLYAELSQGGLRSKL